MVMQNKPSKLNRDQRRKRNNFLWRFTWIAVEDCSTSASKRSAPSGMTFSWLLWVTTVAATYIVNNKSGISQKSLEELLVLIVYRFIITWFVHFDLLHLQASAQLRFDSLQGHNPLPRFFAHFPEHEQVILVFSAFPGSWNGSNTYKQELVLAKCKITGAHASQWNIEISHLGSYVYFSFIVLVHVCNSWAVKINTFVFLIARHNRQNEDFDFKKLTRSLTINCRFHSKLPRHEKFRETPPPGNSQSETALSFQNNNKRPQSMWVKPGL